MAYHGHRLLNYSIMGKLIFKYGAMNAGKSLELLATAHNLKENKIPYQLLKPALDTRTTGTIRTRLGIEEACTAFNKDTSLLDVIDESVSWILVDEAQFMTTAQVNTLSSVVDLLGINVICYGLRTDYMTRLFEGSKRLFEIADELIKLESFCECGQCAEVNARIDADGMIEVSEEGPVVEIGAEKRYKSMCRKCFFDTVFCRQDTVDEQ